VSFRPPLAFEVVANDVMQFFLGNNGITTIVDRFSRALWSHLLHIIIINL
jgi:hypothetical protein